MPRMMWLSPASSISNEAENNNSLDSVGSYKGENNSKSFVEVVSSPKPQNLKQKPGIQTRAYKKKRR